MLLYYLLASCVLCSVCYGADHASMHWTDARKLLIEGQGWPDVQNPYRRYPEKAKSLVTPEVWDLSENSAGLVVRFQTDAPAIRVRWDLTGRSLAMNHMPATGVSGVDLYARDSNKWKWAGVGRPDKQQNEATLVSGLEPKLREYLLYLPLYNGVTSVQIGTQTDSIIKALPRSDRKKPLVFYGTSITQGGCASRPGMAYPAIIGRRLDMPTINLGFSGAGRLEHSVADLISDIDASAFIIDPLPNMGREPVESRVLYLLNQLKTKHPGTPVLLVESAGTQSDYLRGIRNPEKLSVNSQMQKAYRAAKDGWGDRLFLISGKGLINSEGTVDGVHATDLGFTQMADVLAPAIQKALKTR